MSHSNAPARVYTASLYRLSLEISPFGARARQGENTESGTLWLSLPRARVKKQKAGRFRPALCTEKLSIGWVELDSFPLKSFCPFSRPVSCRSFRRRKIQGIGGHITRASPSSSRSSTGSEQPAISTRLAASMAASGETP